MFKIFSKDARLEIYHWFCILHFKINEYFLNKLLKWRNWQTRWTQNPVRLTPGVGSTPTFSTLHLTTIACTQSNNPSPYTSNHLIILIIKN